MDYSLYAKTLIGKEYKIHVGQGIVEGNIAPAKIIAASYHHKPANLLEPEDRHGLVITLEVLDYELEVHQEIDGDEIKDALDHILHGVITYQAGMKLGGALVGGSQDEYNGVIVDGERIGDFD